MCFYINWYITLWMIFVLWIFYFFLHANSIWFEGSNEASCNFIYSFFVCFVKSHSFIIFYIVAINLWLATCGSFWVEWLYWAKWWYWVYELRNDIELRNEFWVEEKYWVGKDEWDLGYDISKFFNIENFGTWLFCIFNQWLSSRFTFFWL